MSVEPEVAISVRGLSSAEYAVADENLTGPENLVMVGRLYGMRRGPSTTRARALLDRFRLSEAAGRAAKTYSGDRELLIEVAPADSAILRTHR